MAARNDGGGGGRKADKIIRDALLAVQRQDPDRLKRVAEAWWNDAETDQQARNALADRLDGKAVQPISGDEENPLTIITRIERVIVDAATKAEQ
jgi:hypothetical protein